MAQMSDFLENKLIDHVFRNTTYAQPGTVYLALYSSDPTDADTGTEISNLGYARKSITFAAPANGSTSNDADIIFAAAEEDWTTITHVGIRDASTDGNLIMHQQLTNAVSVLNGNNFRIPAGQLILTFD